MTKPMVFDISICVVFDLEVFPGRWCVGFHGFDRSGQLSTKIVETKGELERLLKHFAEQSRTLVGYNSERFDVPLIRAILKSIDPYGPAQHIIRENRLPVALTSLPEFPCDHIDISARLRRGGAFPSLKVVAANLGRRALRELPYDPDENLTDSQWEEVKAYNQIDLEHTWALLERLAPEISALASLSDEFGQDLRSVSNPQVVERVFLSEYQRVHGRNPIRINGWTEVRYRPRRVSFDLGPGTRRIGSTGSSTNRSRWSGGAIGASLVFRPRNSRSGISNCRLVREDCTASIRPGCTIRPNDTGSFRWTWQVSIPR